MSKKEMKELIEKQKERLTELFEEKNELKNRLCNEQMCNRNLSDENHKLSMWITNILDVRQELGEMPDIPFVKIIHKAPVFDGLGYNGKIIEKYTIRIPEVIIRVIE